MRIFRVGLFCCLTAVTVGVGIAQQITLVSGTALRVELDHRARVRPGTTLTGHLTEPIYSVDHVVIPAGTAVSGIIQGTHPGLRKDHVRRLLAGDFTPPRLPDVVFNAITIPAHGGFPENRVVINAPAQLTEASVLTLGSRAKKRSIKQQVGDRVGQVKQDTRDTIRQRRYWEIIEKWAVGQLPYHPELLWSRAHFNADLAQAVAVPDRPHGVLPTEDLRGRMPVGTLDARLISSLTSATARRGDAVEAIVTKPLFTTAGTMLSVPEGTHLFGKVVQVKSARRFGRNGSLRFSFSRLDLPSTRAATSTFEVNGHLSAAETASGEHISMDDEGQVKANDSPAKFVEPALLAVLAAGAGQDEDHPGTAAPGAAGYASNGFGLIARVISISTKDTNVIQGFAYYSLAKSIYFNFLDKGQETTFPHDTKVQVTLSER